VEQLPPENGQFILRIPRSEVPGVTAELLSKLPVADLTIEDSSIEAVIDQVYEKGKVWLIKVVGSLSKTPGSPGFSIEGFSSCWLLVECCL
jgi:hypothetical protein